MAIIGFDTKTETSVNLPSFLFLPLFLFLFWFFNYQDLIGNFPI